LTDYEDKYESNLKFIKENQLFLDGVNNIIMSLEAELKTKNSNFQVVHKNEYII
jgi:hypothetical protein